MDLIERYLAAVGRQLPTRQAVDIKAELGDVLLSQVEEREASLGRPLNSAEIEGVLIAFGNPLMVAARYRKTQHLIGPQVFPFWWACVKLMLAIATAIYLVLVALAIFSHATIAQFNRAVPPFVPLVVLLFGAITVIFAGIEQLGGAAALQRWKPRNLPPAVAKPRSHFEIAVTIMFDFVFVLWWFGALKFRSLMPYQDFMRVELAPIWAIWWWPILAYYLAEIVANFIEFFRPAWTWINAAILVGRYAAGIGILLAILGSDHFLVVISHAIPPHALAIAQSNFDLGMRVGILGTIAAMVLRIGLEFWRLRLHGAPQHATYRAV